MKNRKIKIGLIAIVIALLWTLTVSAATADTGIGAPDLTGKRIGVQTGTTAEQYCLNKIENPKIFYFETSADMLLALREDRVDAIIENEPCILYLASTVNDLSVYRLDEEHHEDFAPAFGRTEKGKKLKEQYDSFYTELDKSGDVELLRDKWLNGTEENRTIFDYESLPDTNGILHIATEPTYPPFQYVKDNKLTGFEVELVALFCKQYGYKPVYDFLPFTGIISGVASGKYDMTISALVITPERSKSVLFGLPHSVTYLAAGVLSDTAVSSDNAGSGMTLAQKIEATFIREDRWKMFVDGILVTLRISLFSILFGTALGFLIFMITRKGNHTAEVITAFCKSVIRGFPVVVLLMILFYVVFAKSGLSAEWVAVIGFTLTFACDVHGLLTMGEKSVNPGQMEAAYSLGYSDLKAFFRFILPQIVTYTLPAYKDAIDSHIKATAIVGYISVVDVTRVGDIIRGRTYEAFLPLIAVSIIYFALSFIIKLLLGALAKKLDTRNRKESDILRGLKEND